MKTVLLLVLIAASLHAQDTIPRGIFVAGAYDPLGDRPRVSIAPVAGPLGDSIRAIVERDMDFSDRLTPVRQSPSVAVVEITPVSRGLHVVLRDMLKERVLNVAELDVPANALGRDWRMAVHRISDQLVRWITGQPGVAATRIAYLRDGMIRIIDSDGYDDRALSTEEFSTSPSWSPDGTRVAYATYGPASKIVVQTLATGRSQTIAGPERNAIFLTPAFAHDNETLVYSVVRENGGSLYTRRLAGSDAPRRIPIELGRNEIVGPVFSPDGRRIAFSSSPTGHPELYTVDVDAPGPPNILTDYDFNAKNYRSDPDWSPDGQLVTFQDLVDGKFQIRTIRADGSALKALTNEGENQQPSWAPDSRHLVFTSNRSGSRELWVLDTETFRMRQLTKARGAKLASWSRTIR